MHIKSDSKAVFAYANQYLYFLGIFNVYILIPNLIISMLYFSKIYQNMNQTSPNQMKKEATGIFRLNIGYYIILTFF